MKGTPIVALCGFLGSGKTTHLRRWKEEASLKDAALIVHDLSELGVDAELLAKDEKAQVAGSLVDRVAALHGVHSNQELHSSLKNALDDIHRLTPAAPLVLAESTGAARPWPLIKALTQNPRFYLRHFIVTVDGLNLHRDFADGQDLLTWKTLPHHSPLTKAAQILAEQLSFANVILLTKVDTIPQATVNQQVALLQQLCPQAVVGLSSQGGITLPQLDHIPAPDLLALSQKAQELNATQQNAVNTEVEAIQFRSKRPFHPQRLHDICQSHLGLGLYRTKGFLWLVSRPAHALLWQQSGSQISLELRGLWRAELVKNPDGSLLPEEIDALKNQLKNEDAKFGDRHNELTIIGLERDCTAFYNALESALCTDEEVEHWLNGDAFADPWPKTIRRIS